jgi:hypothetical protein
VNLTKATFFLPMKDNDGRDLLDYHEIVRKAAFGIADGWTFLGYVDGAYRMMDGSQALDRSAAYMVVLSEDKIPELEAVLQEFRVAAKQESIYLELQSGIDFRFLKGEAT